MEKEDLGSVLSGQDEVRRLAQNFTCNVVGGGVRLRGWEGCLWLTLLTAVAVAHRISDNRSTVSGRTQAAVNGITTRWYVGVEVVKVWSGWWWRGEDSNTHNKTAPRRDNIQPCYVKYHNRKGTTLTIIIITPWRSRPP